MIASNTLKYELIRKGIHLISTIIPVLYYFYFSKQFMIILVGTGTLLMILIDYFKKYDTVLSVIYKKLFYNILRDDEKYFNRKIFTGGTYYALGIFFSLLLFEKEIAITSIMIMIWCDTFAALSGLLFGRHKIGTKTLEGSIAFFIVGLLLIAVLPNFTGNILEYYYLIIILIIITVFELINNRFDDNLLIPLLFGLLYTLIIKFL